MIQRELDARVASIQYTETADLNLPAIEVAGDAFEAGVEWADEHPHWISVEDELPPYSQQVLAYSEHATDYGIWWSERYGEGGDFLNLDSNGFSTLRYDDNEPIQVTHWMPLHEPPKKGGEE